MRTPEGSFYYPNKMGRIILVAMEEIIGHSGINSVLNLVSLSSFIDHYPPPNQELRFPFELVSRIQFGLEEAYGPRGGRGVSLRVGRACFRYGLKEFGALMGLTDMAFRLLPLQTKLKLGIQSFADIFNKYSDQRVRVEEDAEHFYWHIERCPVCWDRQAEAPICHLAVGLLQESLYWAGSGKFFEVEEMHCIACGDETCTIKIDKLPMS
jgi:predicted hydrocarbon binding protein